MNKAGVPVELSVAAILRAMIPLLPMPVTTTRPPQAKINSTALSKASAMGPAMRSAKRTQGLSLDPNNVFANVFHGRKEMLARESQHSAFSTQLQARFLPGSERAQVADC